MLYCAWTMQLISAFDRFAIGTLIVERVMNFLGRFNPFSEKRRVLPYVTFRRSEDECVGHSLPQARHLALVGASSIHAIFFVLMGSDRGFGSILAAYATAAFARSFITGTC
jgi:hypothetical protein